jgi:hypothetical protein
LVAQYVAAKANGAKAKLDVTFMMIAWPCLVVFGVVDEVFETHDARIVDQYIERGMLGDNLLRECEDGRRVINVQGN